MNRYVVKQEDLAKLECISTAASRPSMTGRWTRLGLYYRTESSRPIISTVEVFDQVPGADPRVVVFKHETHGTITKAIAWFDDSNLRDRLAEGIGAWEKPANRNGPMFYTGAERVSDVLLWLYPEDEMAGSMLQRPMRFERDFGVPRRTVAHALAAEEAGADTRTLWLAPFVASLRFFNRRAWRTATEARAQQETQDAPTDATGA